MKITRVGVDLAKNVFLVHGVDRAEKVVWQRRLSRGKWVKAILDKWEPGGEVGMEACAKDSTGGLWAHQLYHVGVTPHQVKLEWRIFAAQRHPSEHDLLQIHGVNSDSRMYL